MNFVEHVFWTEVLSKQMNNLRKEIEAYTDNYDKKSFHDLYLIKANAIHKSLTCQRIAALEGVKI